MHNKPVTVISNMPMDTPANDSPMYSVRIWRAGYKRADPNTAKNDVMRKRSTLSSTNCFTSINSHKKTHRPTQQTRNHIGRRNQKPWHIIAKHGLFVKVSRRFARTALAKEPAAAPCFRPPVGKVYRAAIPFDKKTVYSNKKNLPTAGISFLWANSHRSRRIFRLV